jgi:hypothetical protein
LKNVFILRGMVFWSSQPDISKLGRAVVDSFPGGHIITMSLYWRFILKGD